MYHIYYNNNEIPVKYWADVVQFVEKEVLSIRNNSYQQEPNHWFFYNDKKSIEVEFKEKEK